MSLPPPRIPETCPYTSCYCEENIYLLCEAFLKDTNVSNAWDVFAVFISNKEKKVALWSQKAARERGYPVVWDYHVILLLQPKEPKVETTADELAAPRQSQSWVYDFDTTLPLPCPWDDYAEQTFLDDIPPEYKSLFRVVDGKDYTRYFASDRSHMLVDVDGQVQYIKPPPAYECICGPGAAEEGVVNNLMSCYVDMDVQDGRYGGVVRACEKLTAAGSSIASTSGSVNGRLAHSNGSLTHPEKSQDSPYDPNGTSSPSSSNFPINGYSQAPYQNSHNEDIVSHLYHAGFQTGNYADTLLHVHQNVYRLHAIILSRSPFLAHLMSTSPQTTNQRVIFVNLEQEPEVTQEGFAIALGYLYSAVSLNLIRPDNARAVLAAGCLLGGMDDLCQFSYNVCRQSLSVETIGSWLEFIESIPSPSDGNTTPESPKPSVLGQYAQRLRDDVFHFLVVTLPEVLEVQKPAQETSSSPSGRDVLLQIYSRVPFELFKSAVESPNFLIGSDQARFKFAKDAIELRKHGIGRGLGAEETVVLAFGQGSIEGSAVHVTRKMRKRPLWKVNS